MKFYVGTSGFSYSAWKGKFYPKDLPPARMLGFYGEHFNSVEINSTFFRMPEEAGLKAWLKEVPSDFCFSFKAPRRITHMQRLKNSGETVRTFLEIVKVMGKQPGPVLFQLPPNFKKDLPRLSDYMAALPNMHRFAFEFRHESWFDDSVFEALTAKNAALCMADTEDGPNAPFVCTATWGYLRLRRVDYSKAELKNWFRKIHGQKWSEAFAYFRHEDEARGPVFAQAFQESAEG